MKKIPKIIPGEGLENAKVELANRWIRDTQDEENKVTLESIRGGMPVVDVTNDGAVIVENASKNKFQVSGKGLTRRIMRLFTKEEEAEINKNPLSRA